MTARFTRTAITLAALPAATTLAQAAAADGITDREIRNGMVNVQTGPAAALGQGMREGAPAVFKEFDAKGLLHGRTSNPVVADGCHGPDQAIDDTRMTIGQQKVFALFGAVRTPTANAVMPIVKAMDVPLVGADTGSVALRRQVTRQVCNVRASCDGGSEMLVAHLLEKNAKTVAVFHQDDGFGSAVLSGTGTALKKARHGRVHQQQLAARHPGHPDRPGRQARRHRDGRAVCAAGRVHQAGARCRA